LQFIAVTAQFWALRRQHGFRWQWRYELIAVGSLAALSFGLSAAVRGVGSVIGVSDRLVGMAIIAAVIYSTIVALAVVRQPRLVGMTIVQRDAIVRMARRVFANAA
jgi:hypothetical protein